MEGIKLHRLFFWLKDESLEDTDNLPAPEILAAEIAENLESALEQFNNIIEELKENRSNSNPP
jgi:type I restriction enzyme M protein